MAIVLRIGINQENKPAAKAWAHQAEAADYRELVFRLALAITGERESAEDITQEVLIKLHNSKVGKIENPIAWARRVTVRHALHHLKRKRPISEIPETLPVQENTQEAVLVQSVLRSLDPEQRAILGMAIGQGLSYSEIAEALSIPEGTVGSRLNAAKKEFQKRWEQ
ncbi:MAG TPA: sigma-70 family RNA polymerase sigma factor [Fimbriimonadaceae bacterium]|jgi:RNA polymerase sigma-70 factor (ECF subfamily)